MSALQNSKGETMSQPTVIPNSEHQAMIMEATNKIIDIKSTLKNHESKLANAAREFWHQKDTVRMITVANEFAKIEQELYDAKLQSLLLKGITQVEAKLIASTILNTESNLVTRRVIIDASDKNNNQPKRSAWAFEKPGEKNTWFLIGYQKNKQGMPVLQPEVIKNLVLIPE